MLYQHYLEHQTVCPFCDIRNSRILKENDSGFITYAIAPYHKHHLLVVPKKHSYDFTDIADTEWSALHKLLRAAADALKKIGYENYSVLVRNGDNKEKSIEHTHFHAVPNVRLGDLDFHGQDRTVLTAAEIEALMEEFKKAL